MICDNYTSRKDVADLISVKNEEINSLKNEVKYLREKIEKQSLLKKLYGLLHKARIM